MRCAVHNEREAVGVCIGCGAGVCTTCRVTIAGLTYCNACLEAGRYRPPQTVPPAAEPGPMIPAELLGPQTRVWLALGVTGFLLFGIGMHLNWIGTLLWSYWAVYGTAWAVSPSSPVETVSLVIQGISITMVGTSFTAYARIFGSRLCQGTAIASFLSAWWLLIANLMTYTGQVWIYSPYPYYPYWRSGPLFYPYATILVTGLVLLGVTLLLWPSALIATRHLTRQRTLALASGVLFLIAAHMILLPLPFGVISLLSSSSYYYGVSILFSFSGIIPVACLVEPASILSAILMYRSRTPK